MGHEVCRLRPITNRSKVDRSKVDRCDWLLVDWPRSDWPRSDWLSRDWLSRDWLSRDRLGLVQHSVRCQCFPTNAFFCHLQYDPSISREITKLNYSTSYKAPAPATPNDSATPTKSHRSLTSRGRPS